MAADRVGSATQRAGWRSAVVFGLSLVLASAALIGLDFPAPRGDDAVYKSPGAEWVQRGRMAVPCLAGDLATAELGFAHYPPLYPAFFAGWYRAFGVSLASSLAGCYALRLAHAGLVGLVAWRLLRTHAEALPREHAGLVACGVFATWANCAYFDRPEELGLCGAWLGFLIWGMAERSLARRDYAAWGLVCGVSALAAPFAGGLSSLLVAVRWGRELALNATESRRGFLGRGFDVGVAALACLGVVGAWIAWLEWRSPGLLRDQLWSGALPYVGGEQRLPWLTKMRQLPATWLFHPPQLPVALVGLCAAPLAWRGAWRKRANEWTLWSAATCALILVALARPTAYTYFGATFAMLTPLFACGMARFVGRDNPRALRCLGWLLVVICAGLGARDQLHRLAAWPRVPAELRPAAVATRLRELIPPGDRVVATPRHWQVFQGRNPWRDAFLSTRSTDAEALRCQWLVLYPGVGEPPFLHHFELVERSLVAPDDPHSFAYSVWRRRDRASDSQRSKEFRE